MKKTTVAKFLPFLFMASAMNNDLSGLPAAQPSMRINGYGAFGWNGFTGSNADKKKHFNKRRHGQALKRKHRRL